MLPEHCLDSQHSLCLLRRPLRLNPECCRNQSRKKPLSSRLTGSDMYPLLSILIAPKLCFFSSFHGGKTLDLTKHGKLARIPPTLVWKPVLAWVLWKGLAHGFCSYTRLILWLLWFYLLQKTQGLSCCPCRTCSTPFPT